MAYFDQYISFLLHFFSLQVLENNLDNHKECAKKTVTSNYHICVPIMSLYSKYSRMFLFCFFTHKNSI